VIWFAAVVLFDVAALGLASTLRSGQASRLLITSVLVNPVDAVRTAALMGIQGTAAFGASSLAFLRFTKGPVGAALWLGGSLLVWLVVPPLVAALRLRRSDI
jgi:Cu-processing system permease protein